METSSAVPEVQMETQKIFAVRVKYSGPVAPGRQLVVRKAAESSAQTQLAAQQDLCVALQQQLQHSMQRASDLEAQVAQLQQETQLQDEIIAALNGKLKELERQNQDLFREKMKLREVR
jgi:septal ring factor EnvC (AmiA/AmiB activator)